MPSQSLSTPSQISGIATQLLFDVQAPLTQISLGAQSASLLQTSPQKPFMHGKHVPLTQASLGAQSESVAQAFAHVGSLHAWQAPLTHDWPMGQLAPSSTMPSQS